MADVLELGPAGAAGLNRRGTNVEFSDVVRTTFAARDFTSESLDDDVLYRILDLARFAPSG